MEDNLHKGANPKLFHFARLNRRTQTKAEKILWKALRGRNLDGFKFRRQHPIADFIADFFCFERNLIIEVDGDYHNARKQKEYDEGRTYELRELNITVIRFTNKEVLKNLDFVIDKLLRHLNSSHSHAPREGEE
jgi:very-short-patch-repair endonuclease